MKVSAVRKQSQPEFMADTVYQKLRAKILTLELKPGARLVEEELTKSLDAGRTPVREALLLLQGEGLIVRDKGWVVQIVEPAAVRGIFESRIAIEGYATRLAADRLSNDELNALARMVDTMDHAEKLSRKQLNRINQSFHETIVRASHNPLLIQFHEKTQFHYWNMREPIVFADDQRVNANEQHRQMLDALAARDATRAEELAREHVSTTMQIVCRILEE